MDRETFDSTLRSFQHRTPFRPFVVSLLNGDQVFVDQPEFLAVRDGLGLFAGPEHEVAVFDYEGVVAVCEGSNP